VKSEFISILTGGTLFIFYV